ncbi:hypothetical protein C488_16477 [Natrinema pellirubrum DSM 15624]|uniref:Uncharacterized protein n=1 Tax=Natrinema pellirubrum (strain DSM 15624 / CIP 106293 / JCM 10476 / NCIMB 786 / 157) TaxID=797303 RepID=L0JS22_NATP1|nr:hypothetical protein [Natrinema pellirubrum]AGB33181.1 hypothetical protein Natpe_3394 [Natrinema pellirubrum DSM 15624]ELY71846.1 hypothetical protein C488_16477 [Natrinema pellirubrum DSM 15624]
MPDTTIETINTMLDSVQGELEDPDLRFKLRTVRQLLLVIEERHDIGRDALADADLDDSTREDLQQLGYLGADDDC